MFWVVLLLVVAPLVELYVIIQVAQVIGGWETIALLIVESMIGGWLLKRQGLATLAKIGQMSESGRVPGKELIDGFLILVAAALMIAPGFVGDVVAYLLLLPPTRALIRAPILTRFKAGTPAMFTTMGGARGTRFVGTFRAGSYFDTTGTDATPPGPDERPRLDP